MEKTKKSHKILEHLDDVLKQSQNNIVFFGTVGAGKTTLVNKICNEGFTTSDSGDSCTRDIQYAFSICYNMVIIDFPGLKSIENIISHLKIQKTALQNIPVRMICFVVEYFDRIAPIKIEIDEMIKIFENYKNNITIIITKTDRNKKFDEKKKEEIKKDIKKFFQIENVIFTREETNGYAICKELNNFQIKMDNIKNMAIKSDSIVKNMNFYSIPEIEQKIKIFENKFNVILNDHINELNKHPENDLKLAIFFSLKSWKKKCLDEYSKALENINFQETISSEDGNEEDEDEKELEQISIAMFQLDGAIKDKYEDFRKRIEKIVEVKINNYNGDYNKFKKCPHCGQIWFKIIGCDEMVCGNRTTILDKISGRWKNFEVTYNYDTRTFTINSSVHEDSNIGNDEEKFGLREDEKKMNPKRKLERKAEIKPIGCGNKLNWREMEDCTEKVVEMLKENSLENDYYSDSLEYYDKLKQNK